MGEKWVRSENFNGPAMEEKIKLNKEKGFDKKGIVAELKKEIVSRMENISIQESRIVELKDQINYIEEKYPDWWK